MTAAKKAPAKKAPAKKAPTVRDLGIAAGHDVPKTVVGLIGKKRSGKDTFATGLIERGFERFAFADNLKASVLAVDPLVFSGFVRSDGFRELPNAAPIRLSTIIERQGWEAAKERPEVRRLLQFYGVAIRDLDEGFWVRSAMDKALAVPRSVITDVRFPNEVAAVHEAGGTIVRVVRPGLVSTDQHVSETALDDYPADLTVENSGTAEDLIDLARSLSF